jgi:hypothetical protein
MSHHHWLDYRIQRNHLPRTSRPHLVLPDRHRLYFRETSSWRTPPSLPIQSWSSRNCCKWNCFSILVGGIHFLLLSQYAKSNPGGYELELSYFRVHFIFLTCLLLCIWETQLLGPSRVRQEPIVKGLEVLLCYSWHDTQVIWFGIMIKPCRGDESLLKSQYSANRHGFP